MILNLLAYFHLEILNAKKMKNKEALDCFQKALKQGGKKDTINHFNPSPVYYQIAQIYLNLSQKKLALDNYYKAFLSGKKLGDIDGANKISKEIEKIFYNKSA